MLFNLLYTLSCYFCRLDEYPSLQHVSQTGHTCVCQHDLLTAQP